MAATKGTILTKLVRRAGRLAVLLGVLVAASASAADVAATDRSTSFDELVAQLLSPDFRKRLAAEKELARIADQHIPELAAAAAHLPEEGGQRIVNLLELVLLKFADHRGDAAERALQKLAERPGPTGVAAADILMGNARLIETRAREAIRELGGAVTYYSPESFYTLRSRAVAAGTGAGFGEIGVMHTIWLYEDWKGGKQGLWHIRRLAHIPDLVVYTMNGNGLDPLTIAAAAGPGASVHVEQRGGCLGIRGLRSLSRCIVEGVIPGSAADRAGLQEGDEITHLNGEKVHSFDELVEMLKGARAGETVELVVQQGLPTPHPFDRPSGPLEQQPENRTIKVKLGSWKDGPHGEQEAVRSPSGFGGPFGPPLGDRVPPPPERPTPIERNPTEWRRQ